MVGNAIERFAYSMTSYRKTSTYQLESGTSWFERLWQAFRDSLSSRHACIRRLSLVLPSSLESIRVSVRAYIRPLSRSCLHRRRTYLEFARQFSRFEPILRTYAPRFGLSTGRTKGIRNLSITIFLTLNRHFSTNRYVGTSVSRNSLI